MTIIKFENNTETSTDRSDAENVRDRGECPKCRCPVKCYQYLNCNDLGPNRVGSTFDVHSLQSIEEDALGDQGSSTPQKRTLNERNSSELLKIQIDRQRNASNENKGTINKSVKKFKRRNTSIERRQSKSLSFKRLFEVLGKNIWSPWGIRLNLPRMDVVVARYCNCDPYLRAVQALPQLKLMSQRNSELKQFNTFDISQNMKHSTADRECALNRCHSDTLLGHCDGQSSLHSPSHCRWFRGTYIEVLDSLAEDICACLNAVSCGELEFMWAWINADECTEEFRGSMPENSLHSIEKSRIKFEIYECVTMREKEDSSCEMINPPLKRRRMAEQLGSPMTGSTITNMNDLVAYCLKYEKTNENLNEFQLIDSNQHELNRILIDQLIIQSSFKKLEKAGTLLLSFISWWGNRNYDLLVIKGSALVNLFICSPYEDFLNQGNRHSCKMSFLLSPTFADDERTIDDQDIIQLNKALGQHPCESSNERLIDSSSESLFSSRLSNDVSSSETFINSAFSSSGNKKEKDPKQKSDLKIQEFIRFVLRDNRLRILLANVDKQIEGISESKRRLCDQAIVKGHECPNVSTNDWIVCGWDDEFFNTMIERRRKGRRHILEYIEEVSHQTANIGIKQTKHQNCGRNENLNISQGESHGNLKIQNKKLINHLCINHLKNLIDLGKMFQEKMMRRRLLISKRDLSVTHPMTLLPIRLQLLRLKSSSRQILRLLLTHRIRPEDDVSVCNQIELWDDYINKIKSLLTFKQTLLHLKDQRILYSYLLSQLTIEVDYDTTALKNSTLIKNSPSNSNTELSTSSNSTTVEGRGTGHLYPVGPSTITSTFDTTSIITPDDHNQSVPSWSQPNIFIHSSEAMRLGESQSTPGSSPETSHASLLPTRPTDDTILECPKSHRRTDSDYDFSDTTRGSPIIYMESNPIPESSSIHQFSLPSIPSTIDISNFLKKTIENLSSDFTIEFLDQLTHILPTLLQPAVSFNSPTVEFLGMSQRSPDGSLHYRMDLSQTAQANRVVIRHLMKVISMLKSKKLNSRTSIPAVTQNHLTTLKCILQPSTLSFPYRSNESDSNGIPMK